MLNKQIAEMLYVDPTYLTRKFAQKYGNAPKKYMIEKRISLAKKLLRETEASIMKISNSVGYVDQLYFSHIFKKKEGIAPLAYRKQFK